MKKVRYAIGALGIAPAMALPFTNGAAAATHAPGNSAKRVTLTTGQFAPDLTCYHQADHSGRAHSRNLSEYVDWNGANCVYKAHGELNISVSHLAMRTRAYSRPGGARVWSNYNSHGTFPGGHTSFTTTVNRDAGQVCIALVFESTHVLLNSGGPICVNT
jgi:hypothetical protein